MSLFPRLRKLRLKRHLLKSRTRQSTSIRVRITPSLGIMGHTTVPRRQRLPTDGQANSSINNCDDLQWLQSFRATGVRSSSGRAAILPSSKNAVEKGLSKARVALFMQLGSRHGLCVSDST